jgi:hypothetical protein
MDEQHAVRVRRAAAARGLFGGMPFVAVQAANEIRDREMLGAHGEILFAECDRSGPDVED